MPTRPLMPTWHNRISDGRRPLSLVVVAAWVAFGGSIGMAQQSQYPTFTTDHLNEAMKTVGLAFGLAGTSAARSDHENAKDYLIRSRDQLATTITFWRDRKEDEAISILRETLKRMDALDAALSAVQVDGAAVKTLTGEINGRCDACHAKYR